MRCEMSNNETQSADRAHEHAIGWARFRRFAAAAVVLFVGALMLTAQASSAGLSGLSGRSVGSVGHSYSGSHLRGLQQHGAGYARTPGHYGNLGSTGGWYHQGFGGTSNPGWDYGFGPRLGGIGH